MHIRCLPPAVLVLLLAIATNAQSDSSTISTSPTSTNTYPPVLHPRFTATDDAPQLTPVASSTLSAPSSATTSATSKHKSTDTSLVSYYFVFLALLVCVLVAVGWILIRQRRIRALRSQAGRQTALEQDLNQNSWPIDQERWTGRTRWIHGRGRSDGSANGDYRTRPEEGLNEVGEAPPPYKGRQSGDRQTAGELARPEHVLDRSEAGLKPPDYEEAYALSDIESGEGMAQDSGNGHRHGEARVVGTEEQDTTYLRQT